MVATKNLCQSCKVAPPKTERSKYCEPCRREARLKQWRNGVAPATCEICSLSIDDPYSGGQKYHDYCAPEARRRRQRSDSEAPADEQMTRLFRDYHARESIALTAAEGDRIVIISDAQIPFIDEAFWKAFLSFYDTYKPQETIINGDWADCYDISVFDQNPARLFNLRTEADMVKDTMLDLDRRKPKNGKKRWADGNHEERWNRAIWRQGGALSQFIPDLYTAFDLEHLVDSYVPYGKHFDLNGFIITHGNFVSQYSAYTARRHYDRYHSSGCNGHTHRVGSYSHTDGRSRSHTWYEIGCFCRKDLEYVKGVANWQQGFLCGEVRNGAFHPQLIRVIETDAGRGFFAAGGYYEIGP
jgi:hypothetical protein